MAWSVSIITINFNNADGLCKTINSVANQSYPHIQYIVIDGGSTDGSQDIIRRNALKIDHWVSESDNGIYDAMNKGIRVATGNYLLFLNSGDCLVSDTILTEFLANFGGADIVLGNIVGSNGQEIKLWYNIDFYDIWRYGAHHQAMFIKRSLFDEIGLYNDSGDIASDWQFLMLSLFKYCKSASYIDKAVSVYDLGGVSSLKEKQSAIKQERLRFLKMNFPDMPLYQIAVVNTCRHIVRKINSIQKRFLKNVNL